MPERHLLTPWGFFLRSGISGEIIHHRPYTIGVFRIALVEPADPQPTAIRLRGTLNPDAGVSE